MHENENLLTSSIKIRYYITEYAVQRNNCCVLWESYKTQKRHCVGRMYVFES